MSFDVDVVRRLGQAIIRARFQAGGGLTVLVGPSGVGKTSILAMIAGLVRPDSGHVAVAGETLFDSDRRLDRPPERRRLGCVFQDGRLFPHLTVRANLTYGRRAEGMPLAEAVDVLGLEGLLGRWPRTLSGGEAQRVALGRALLSAPRALLLDEPLTSVDPARRDEILTVIERLRDRLATPILYVTHDAAEAARLATRTIAITREA